MSLAVSVVVCVYNGADTLSDCLRGLEAQSLRRDSFEVIVVDDGSTDNSAELAQSFGVRVERCPHRGLPAARNTGWKLAQGKWIAFTDDDCGPTRNWLSLLLRTVEQDKLNARVLGAAGRILGFPSGAAVARYIEARGGFNTEQHLAHPQFPYAPMGNVMYRREALALVNGLDERYSSYESCNLHTRLRLSYGGEFYYEPRALVLHRHYNTWRAYFRQQRSYGRGMAQFMWHSRDRVAWSARREVGAWLNLITTGSAVLVPGSGERALLRRGDFVKQLAQRIGFVETYWSRRERARW